MNTATGGQAGIKKPQPHGESFAAGINYNKKR